MTITNAQNIGHRIVTGSLTETEAAKLLFDGQANPYFVAWAALTVASFLPDSSELRFRKALAELYKNEGPV